MTTHRSPLDVVPATAGMLQALIEDEEAFRKDYDLALAAGYEVFDGSLGHALSVVRAGGAPAWSTHLFIDTTDRTVVGVGGYTGPPVDGMVEIGYAIAPDRRNRGYATEAARQLIDHARSRGVECVLAHTLPTHSPSTAVLRHLGFRRVDDVTDPEEGTVWRWELALESARPRSRRSLPS